MTWHFQNWFIALPAKTISSNLANAMGSSCPDYYCEVYRYVMCSLSLYNCDLSSPFWRSHMPKVKGSAIFCWIQFCTFLNRSPITKKGLYKSPYSNLELILGRNKYIFLWFIDRMVNVIILNRINADSVVSLQWPWITGKNGLNTMGTLKLFRTRWTVRESWWWYHGYSRNKIAFELL